MALFGFCMKYSMDGTWLCRVDSTSDSLQAKKKIRLLFFELQVDRHLSSNTGTHQTCSSNRKAKSKQKQREKELEKNVQWNYQIFTLMIAVPTNSFEFDDELRNTLFWFRLVLLVFLFLSNIDFKMEKHVDERGACAQCANIVVELRHTTDVNAHAFFSNLLIKHSIHKQKRANVLHLSVVLKWIG